ncbi:MAG: hypothetical protein NC209_05855 [Alistipes sp.]|nr:hypothetical protein [Alistipes senegalensis]MCM1250648.1 hypothetical protein [Alistipes sp.]
MKRTPKFILRIVGGIALLAAAVGAAMWLWNALLPELFGWKTIGYWQMLGLLVLFHLFFGHLGHPSAWDTRRHLHERLHGMSPEQRREFIRRRMRSLCEERRNDGASEE